ncbi:MAG TPA: GntR family transcriptional regulator [Thermoleophilaceae bacterium]|nr:GntR family transcriptional regulator [Thermoleophilaceae bacterium]
MSATSETDPLREAIVRGELAPNSRLVEADLSQAFSMSRGAVRTALVRLEQEGLVTREPNRGARVRHIGDEEAVEILQARAALEGLAAAEAARRIDAKGAKRLEKALAKHTRLVESGDLLAASDANAALHEALLELSGHTTVQQLIRTLKSQTVRFQFRTILVPGRPAASHKEHAAIVNAVLEGKPKQAEKAMRDHLLSVADTLRESLRTGR